MHPSSANPSLARFIRALPKTETHLHLEGALPWALLNQLDSDRFACPPASWDPHFRFHHFAHFESELLDMAGAWFTSADRYHQAARLVFSGLQVQNVRYVETSFASGVVDHCGLSGEEVASAIRSAAPVGLEVRVFLGIHHNGWTKRTCGFLQQCLHWKDLDGLDLHGTEDFPLEPWTAKLWYQAREHGKFTKAHAGEFCGPEFVRRVLDELGVRRIEHGVRAAEDPDLVARLRDEAVVLDLCPLSNLKLGVVPSLQAHPIGEFLRSGVRCTVSTDDPLSFGNTLEMEYASLVTEAGLKRSDLILLARHGFEAALIDPALRDSILRSMPNDA